MQNQDYYIDEQQVKDGQEIPFMLEDQHIQVMMSDNTSISRKSNQFMEEESETVQKLKDAHFKELMKSNDKVSLLELQVAKLQQQLETQIEQNKAIVEHQ